MTDCSSVALVYELADTLCYIVEIGQLLVNFLISRCISSFALQFYCMFLGICKIQISYVYID
jgi:hypothetical protein